MLAAYSIPVAPEGPGTPFATPGLIFIDSLRVLVVVLVIACLCMKPWMFKKACTPGQIIRFIVIAMLSVVGMTIELEHIGDYANWRLFFVLVAMILNTWGNYSFLRYETPGEFRPDKKTLAARDAAELRAADEDRQRFHGS